MNERTLLASINGDPVGTLHEENGIWTFRYSDEWLKNPDGYALSPHLPLRTDPIRDLSTTRPVQWYFDNLLPEENQRTLLASDARLDAADAFGLLGYYGSESAGSLTLLPPESGTQELEALHLLSDEALYERILQLPRASLTHASIKRMSHSGAQHKLAVVFQDGQLFEPAGATPSTHILKPDHPDSDYPHSVINEWFVMRLAKKLGIDVPDVHRRYVPAPVYIIDRFDRTKNEEVWQRRHVIDACQLLGLDRGFKYSEGSIENLAVLANACRSPAVARTRLFSWLVFNILVGNTDVHLKNLSFMVAHDGIQLAPHYDLLGTACYETRSFDKNGWPDQTQLAWPILDVRYISEVDRALLIRAGTELSMTKVTAERLLDNLCRKIGSETEALYAEFESENIVLAQQDSGLRATLAGESRCLRTIQYTVIREMTQKLGR
ncbi:MAG: HipA domain-containing protein [Nitrosomonadaceae bacterium]